MRINVKEEPPSKRNTQLIHRYLRTPSNANDENSVLSLFGKDSEDEKDSNNSLVKRDSRYKILRNPDDDDPDLSFFKKNSRYQTIKNPENEDSDVNFSKKNYRRQIMKDNDNEDPDQSNPKKDSRRHVASRQDYDYPSSDDYIKDSGRRNSENLYESEYETSEKDYPVPYEVTQANSDYEDSEDYEMPIAAQPKVKREELAPIIYNQIAEAMDKELKGMLGANSSNPCKNCGALKLENDQLKQQIDNESSRYVFPF